MLKVAVIILAVACVYAGIYSLMAIITPETMVQSTFEAVTGKTVDSVQDADYLKALSHETRGAGFYALAAVIFSFAILFTGFRKAQQWAWWSFLVGSSVAWLWGIIGGIVTGDKLHLSLHAIGMVLLLAGILLPVKVFFGKAVEEAEETEG